MPEHIKKYYTYKDEFPEQDVTKEFCEHTIREIVKTYKKEFIFRMKQQNIKIIDNDEREKWLNKSISGTILRRL